MRTMLFYEACTVLYEELATRASIETLISHASGVATYNSYIQTAVANVGSSRVVYVDTSTWVNPTTDLAGDGLHPTEAGHTKIAAQLINLLGNPFPFRTRRLARNARRVAMFTLSRSRALEEAHRWDTRSNKQTLRSRSSSSWSRVPTTRPEPRD